MQDPREIQELMQKGLKELQSMKVCTRPGRGIAAAVLQVRVDLREFSEIL